MLYICKQAEKTHLRLQLIREVNKNELEMFSEDTVRTSLIRYIGEEQVLYI